MNIINTNPTQSEWTPRLISGLTSWLEYSNRLGGLVDMLKGKLVSLQERGKEYRMPSTIKLLDLVSISNTRHLWPKEFDGLVKAWEETKSNDQLGIIADWLDDNDEPELAHAFRWCYRRNIRMLDTGLTNGFYISKNDLPLCLQYTGGISATSTNVGICGVIACLADILARIREVIE